MNLWEELFLILWYGPNGLTLADVRSMHVQFRKWFLERIAAQRKKESEAMKRGAKKTSTSRAK